MQKVSVVACLKAKSGLEEKVKNELVKLVEASRKEKGCLNYDLHVQVDNPGVFVIYENWVSRMALSDQMETAQFLELGSLQDQLFVEPAKITILKMVSEAE